LGCSPCSQPVFSLQNSWVLFLGYFLLIADCKQNFVGSEDLSHKICPHAIPPS
jgi:hypothetical protein